MVDDIVINSYKEQIKESNLKANAVKIAGFDIIIEEIKRRGVNIDKLLEIFNKIRSATKKEELDVLTVDELNSITDDINIQVTKQLISPVEIADLLVRKSKIIAKEKSLNGKVDDNDSYIKVGFNLSSEVNKHGIASGLNTCVKNYCIQKLYQANYKEKIREKEKELGIDNLEEEKVFSPKKRVDTKKNETMVFIFNKSIGDYNNESFENIKNNYIGYVNKKINNLSEYK